MNLPNTTVQDITADVNLIDSKPKIQDNDDKLIENDLAIELAVESLEGGSFVGASRWEDIILNPASLGTGPNAPDLIILTGAIQAYSFDGGSTTEELFGSFELPHNYKEGTDLRPHIHWAPVNANVGNVKWQLEYTIAEKAAVFPASTTITCTDAATGTLKHEVEEFSVSGAGLTIGTVIMFRLFRNPSDAADTYGSDAILLSLGIHYQVDSTGSTEVMAK